MAHWWQAGVVYQIYPRSFQDTNQDGIGDLPGIIQRLDYLQWLGIDAIWISPIYPSPMADFGYDVSDHIAVHPMFGTLSDIDRLIAAAHQHDLKVILDFVPNHTSDQHPWFLESRSSRDNPKRDWYIWRDSAADGGPPTNWISRFSGPAWEWDPLTQQYYLHSFLAEQPDLNWRNPAVREAMLDVLRFWFDRGIDGFRVDVSYRVMKDAQFRDNPSNLDWGPGQDPSKQVIERYTKNIPEIHQFNRWLRQVSDEYADRVLIGEINLPITQLVKHYGDSDEFHLPFNFRLIYSSWDAATVKDLVAHYEDQLPPGAWPNWVLGNHDQPRVATRVKPAQARVAAVLLLTLRGTPTLYYGDEIGMENTDIPPDRVQDPWEKMTTGLNLGRDPQRTPMQWDESANAGFCPADVEPWLPVAANYRQLNVETESANPNSMLNLTRELIALRRRSHALTLGSCRIMATHEPVFAYLRERDNEKFLIVLNFSNQEQTISLPIELGQPQPLISTLDLAPSIATLANFALRGDEGLVIRLEQT
jgi:alpha-glucosidase